MWALLCLCAQSLCYVLFISSFPYRSHANIRCSLHSDSFFPSHQSPCLVPSVYLSHCFQSSIRCQSEWSDEDELNVVPKGLHKNEGRRTAELWWPLQNGCTKHSSLQIAMICTSASLIYPTFLLETPMTIYILPIYCWLYVFRSICANSRPFKE